MRPPQHHNNCDSNPLNLHIYKEGEENFEDKIVDCKLPWYKRNLSKQTLNQILLTFLSFFILLISVNLIFTESDAAEKPNIMVLSKGSVPIQSGTQPVQPNLQSFEEKLNKQHSAEIQKQNFSNLILCFSISFFLLVSSYWAKQIIWKQEKSEGIF